MKINRKIGAHISISGGIYKAVERARKLEINTIQIFLKNSNRWEAKQYSDEDLQLYHNAISSFNDLNIFAHSGYLINLAGDGDNYIKSINAVIDEIKRAELLNIKYIVIHPGSHKDMGLEYGINKIAQSIDKIFATYPSKVKLLLETTAGMGSSVGHKFEHLQEIIEKSSSKNNLGVCLDTCHIFAAGYDISKKESCKKVIESFHTIIGLDSLKLIHVNDSKKEYNSRVDRHTHIGNGFIGNDGFNFFLNDDRIKNIPLILETPKKMEGVTDKPDDMKADIENLKRLNNILL